MEDSRLDHPDIHRRFARLPCTLAVDSMLANQNQRISQNIERYQQTTGYCSMLELTLLNFVLEVDECTRCRVRTWGHRSIRKMRMLKRRTRDYAG